MIYKECEGCDCEGSCVLEPYYINEQGNKTECPCQTCLIKGICNKLCDNIITYHHSFKSLEIKLKVNRYDG